MPKTQLSKEELAEEEAIVLGKIYALLIELGRKRRLRLLAEQEKANAEGSTRS